MDENEIILDRKIDIMYIKQEDAKFLEYHILKDLEHQDIYLQIKEMFIHINRQACQDEDISTSIISMTNTQIIPSSSNQYDRVYINTSFEITYTVKTERLTKKYLISGILLPLSYSSRHNSTSGGRVKYDLLME